MKTIIASVFVLSLFIPLTHAEVYKWVDEKGTVHFTEDPETIPEKYRDRAKSRTTEEDLMSPQEKIRAKKKYDEDVRERKQRQQIQYEKSIQEEERRKKSKEGKEIVEEKQRINVEKEERARKIREKQEEERPVYVLERCSDCGGKGYIVCSSCGGTGRNWSSISSTRRCLACGGEGFRLCRGCNTKGYRYRRIK